MELLNILNKRFSTKKFIPNKELSKEQIEMVENLLQLSPSSTNAQPWHFILASTKEGKEKIAKSAAGFYKFNEEKVLDASAVVVFCGRHDLDEKYLLEVLEKEDKDGRFSEKQIKLDQHSGRSFFVNKHRYELKDIEHWAEKQVFLNLGQFLLGVAILGLDAIPMEGFNFNVLDKEFKLREKGFTSCVVVSIGYHSEDDFNAKLPKSRLTKETIIERV